MNKKGFTLVEIIISLAIFAIISVGFLGMFTTVFINTYKTSVITENSFASQSVMEETILDTKTKINNNNLGAITLTSKTVTIFDELGGDFQKDLTVYHVKETVTGGRPIESFVAQTRPPKLIVPNIISDVTITANTLSVEEFPNIGMKSLLSLNAAEPVIDNPGYLIQHLYYWYKSTNKHYIKSMPPAFPDDYSIIPAYTGKIISTLTDDYSSKLVRLLVTPVGEKGQMGSGYTSNDLLISGLPINNNLLVHMDASMVSLTDDVSSDRVIRWRDIGPNKINAITEGTVNRRPQITPHTIEDSVPHQVLGISRLASGGNQYLSLDTNNTVNSNKRNLTVYVVAKFDDVYAITSDVTIIESRHNNVRYRWTFGTNGDGQLQLDKRGNNQNASIPLTDSEFRTGDWSILRLDVYDNAIRVYNGLNLVGEVYTFTDMRENTSGFNTDIYSTPMRIYFNNIGYTMGEILVYEGKQSNEDSQKVLGYLYGKFIGE